jgi:REP element-mobilizing transposase RayT
VAQGDKLQGAAAGVSASSEEVLGRHLWARGYLAASSGTITDEMIQEYINEQEGEAIHDNSRFQIDNP